MNENPNRGMGGEEMSPFPWPLEETAECGCCRHIGNVCDFMVGEEEDGSECPKCGFPEETPPVWDEEDIVKHKKLEVK